jgi:DNA-binding MarR family transcriptional regulator
VLAERAGVTRATISGLLDGLQREGLLQRRNDDGDGRRLQIVLTAPGKRLAEAVRAAHAGSVGCSRPGCDEQQQLSAAAQGLAAHGRRRESAA